MANDELNQSPSRPSGAGDGRRGNFTNHGSPRGVEPGDQLVHLVNKLVDQRGETIAAKLLGISRAPLLRIMAGRRCAQRTRAKARAYFAALVGGQ